MVNVITKELLEEIREKVKPIEKDLMLLNLEAKRVNTLSAFSIGWMIPCAFSIGRNSFISAFILWSIMLGILLYVKNFEKRKKDKIKYLNLVINQVKVERR